MRLDVYGSWKEDAGESRGSTSSGRGRSSCSPAARSPSTVSYYFYGILEQGESIKLEDTFLQFNSIFGLPVDLMIGQFQVSDPLFKRELRLERNDYAIFKTRVGARADRPHLRPRSDRSPGTRPAAIDVIAQVVNGNGIDPAEDDTFDDNSFKNFGLRVSRAFGPVRVGVFGYWGEQEDAATGHRSKLTYLGPDLIVDLGEKWQLNLEYLAADRRRSRSSSVAPGPTYETSGGFAELHFFPQGQDGRWVALRPLQPGRLRRP